jgi:hypothetical protein
MAIRHFRRARGGAISTSSIPQKIADAAVGFSWFAWFLSYIDEINKILQFFALIFAIGASIAAIIYHTRKHK